MKALVRVSLGSPGEAEAVRRALSVDDRPGNRSSDTLSARESELTLDIEATDMGALRASLNSRLRQIKIADAALMDKNG